MIYFDRLRVTATLNSLYSQLIFILSDKIYSGFDILLKPLKMLSQRLSHSFSSKYNTTQNFALGDIHFWLSIILIFSKKIFQ